MKKIIILVVALVVLGGAVGATYFYFRGSDKHLQLIPKDAMVVGSFDYISLASKADLKKIQELQFYKDLQEKAASQKDSSDNKKWMEILKNPLSSGINLLSDIYFFTAHVDNKTVVALDVDIKNEAQFRDLLKRVSPDSKIITEKNYSAVYNNSWALAWNEKGLLLATIQGYGEGEMPKKFFEDAFNRKRSESIMSNKFFLEFEANKKDISLFMNLEEYSKAMGSMSPLPVPEPLAKMWNGAYYIFNTTFENNRVHTTWALKSDSKDAEKMNYLRDKGLSEDVTNMITTKETYALLCFALNPKKLLELADQVPMLKDSKEEFAQKNGLQVKDLENIFGGDLAFSLNDFTQTERPQEGSEYMQADAFPQPIFSMNFTSNNKPAVKKLLEGKMSLRPDNIYIFSMGAGGDFYLAENKTGFTFTNDSVLARNISTGKALNPLRKDLSEMSCINPVAMYVDLDFANYPLPLRNYMSKMVGENFYNEFMTYSKVLKDFRTSGKFSTGEASLNLSNGEGNSLYRLIAQADEVYKISKKGQPL